MYEDIGRTPTQINSITTCYMKGVEGFSNVILVNTLSTNSDASGHLLADAAVVVGNCWDCSFRRY